MKLKPIKPCEDSKKRNLIVILKQKVGEIDKNKKSRDES